MSITILSTSLGYISFDVQSQSLPHKYGKIFFFTFLSNPLPFGSQSTNAWLWLIVMRRIWYFIATSDCQEIECYGGMRDQFRQIGSYSREDKVQKDNEFLSVTATSYCINLAFRWGSLGKYHAQKSHRILLKLQDNFNNFFTLFLLMSKWRIFLFTVSASEI